MRQNVCQNLLLRVIQPLHVHAIRRIFAKRSTMIVDRDIARFAILSYNGDRLAVRHWFRHNVNRATKNLMTTIYVHAANVTAAKYLEGYEEPIRDVLKAVPGATKTRLTFGTAYTRDRKIKFRGTSLLAAGLSCYVEAARGIRLQRSSRRAITAHKLFRLHLARALSYGSDPNRLLGTSKGGEREVIALCPKSTASRSLLVAD